MKIQEKNLMIIELENDLINIKKKMQESDLASERTRLKVVSSDNKDLVDTMVWLFDRIKNQTLDDNHLMENLGNMVHRMDMENPDIRSNGDDLKENINNNRFSSSSFSTKKAEGVERSPLGLESF